MILLAYQLKKCPRVWQNYINAINPSGLLRHDEIDEIMERDWNGYIYQVDDSPDSEFVVQFKSNADQAFFILRWSS